MVSHNETPTVSAERKSGKQTNQNNNNNNNKNKRGAERERDATWRKSVVGAYNVNEGWIELSTIRR
jgi:hypothetical protein